MADQNVSISKWRRRNIWPLPSGEVAVRPGLRKVRSNFWGDALFAWSIRRDTDDEVFYYSVEKYATNGHYYVSVRDEWGTQEAYYDWGASKPSHVTWGSVGGQVMIASPGLPTLWGFEGQELFAATVGSSVNPDLEELSIPRGLVCSWANRMVFASGNELQFSDAGNPRSIVDINVVNPPGAAIMGLHVSGVGDLYVVTTTGTYKLPPEASYGRGETVFGVFRKVTDYAATRFGCTEVVRGRVWGVTKKGIRLIDTAEQYEIFLDDPRVGMATGDRISVPDYRPLARIIAGADGPIVSAPALNAACMFDEASRNFSWWTANMSDPFRVAGFGQDEFGADVLFLEDGQYQIIGNADESDTSVYGVFLGRLPTPPEASLVLRKVQASSDTGQNIVVTHGGTSKTASPPQQAPIPGVTAAGAADWKSIPVRSRALDFAKRSDDHGMEVGAQGCLSRIDETISVRFTGSGTNRESN